jgi:6-phosphogluconolactonase (cycloisomerase 2 family)
VFIGIIVFGRVMRFTTRLAGIGVLALAASVLFAWPASASTSTARHGAAAVFVQTDNPNGNAIVAYDRSPDGTLHQARTYPTGGLGGVLGGSVVDHLASQGSLAYDRGHGLLYAVNAGSNTITVFGVHGDRLSRQQVISSGGDFPVSIGLHGHLVFALNARGGGSVQGYRLVSRHLVLIPGWHRSLGLDPSLTPEFTSTPGQVGFTPDGSKIVVTTKGNGNSIDVFTLNGRGGLAARPVVNAEPDAVPFAFTFDAHGHLVVTEAGPNAVATFSIRHDGTLTAIAQVATGQAATCWISGTGSSLYASNAGSANVSRYQDNGSGALTALGNTSTDPGTVDSVISSDGRYLYVQTGGNGIVDEYRIHHDGSLSAIGSVTVPGAVGGEGVAAS